MDSTDNYTNSYNQYTYSRWASPSEFCSDLQKISLVNPTAALGGIPLSTELNNVYIEGGDSHSLIIVSTGSKKTRLIAMPSLRFYAYEGESFIATDPKVELYEKT